jgi:hypothetical protein
MARGNINYVGNIIQIVNRTPIDLEYTYDGRRHVLKPGVNYVTDDHIRFAIEQNVIPGTADPLQPSIYQSFVGVPSQSGRFGDCSDVPAELLALLGPERIDRSKLPGQRAHEHVQLNATDIPRRRTPIEDVSRGMRDPGKFGGDD